MNEDEDEDEEVELIWKWFIVLVPVWVSMDCASLARVRTLGPVKVREFVSFMC